MGDEIQSFSKEMNFVPMFMVMTEEEIQGPTHMINLVKENNYKTEVMLDGKETTMEIDTGSRVILLSKKTFKEIGGDIERLKKSRLILKGYTGNEIRCLGEKIMSVQINGEVKDVIIRVVDGEGPSLMGRDIISQFKLPWENIF